LSQLCVSLQGATIRSLQNKLARARRFGPELVELRLDLIHDLDPRKLDSIGDLLEGNEILTIRSRGEGGMGTFSEKERIALIDYAILHLTPRIFDIEIATLAARSELCSKIRRAGADLIASFHDLKRTPKPSELSGVISSCPVSTKFLYALKITCKANSLEDNLKILSLYSKNSVNSKKLVAFCMGECGIPSRVLAPLLGSPYSYVSLPGDPVAPGQLDIQTVGRITVGRQDP
jgi:3-dehydroquinate dehydratase type I